LAIVHRHCDVYMENNAFFRKRSFVGIRHQIFIKPMRIINCQLHIFGRKLFVKLLQQLALALGNRYSTLYRVYSSAATVLCQQEKNL
jgi:hypothetical protein